MMKPDLKVTIAWGTQTQFVLAKKIKDTYDDLRKKGYPVNARLIFSSGDGTPISQKAVEIFSDFDYAIFLFGIKSIDITPSDGEMVPILRSTDFREVLAEFTKDTASVISPKLSHNIIYELGIAKATHRDPSSIFWFSNGGDVSKYFPADLDKPAIVSLDKYKSDDNRVKFIIATVHSKIKKSFDFLGDSYEDKVPHILSERQYRPNLSNIITRKNIIDIDFLGSYNSPLDAYFENEYAFFDEENIAFNLDCRIQYFIDRAVLFVYLRNDTLWVEKISVLYETCEKLRNKNDHYHMNKLAISILNQVMRYHKMMARDELNYSHLLAVLEEASKNAMLINSMLRCLCFDYKGLCEHKIALEHLSVSIGKKSFYATSKEDIHSLMDSQNKDEKEKAREYLSSAVESFNEVLRVSKAFSMENGYLWEGFALYNRARCKYILSILDPSHGHNWENDMDLSIKTRGEYAERYEGIKFFPVVISHNLRAEYYHASLERHFYHITQSASKFHFVEFEKIKDEIEQWSKRSSFYTDVLSVTKKLNTLEDSIEISAHEVELAIKRIRASRDIPRKLREDLIRLLEEAKEASLEGNESKRKAVKDGWKWFLRRAGTSVEKIVGILSDLATIVSFFGIGTK